MSQANQSVLVAFSGGLDTSMLVPYMREKYAASQVVTCVVDTGGMSPQDIQHVADRALEVGASEHVYINAAQEFYDEIIKYLIFGNVSRDGYPLCVGAERLIQARAAILEAKKRSIKTLAHGCTGAGNDQYRFDLVAYVLGAGIEAIAPVRDHGITRAFSQQFLKARGISVPEKSAYSYNVGLWGVSIGGAETHTAQGLIPETAWHSQPKADLTPQKLTITFEQGVPVACQAEDRRGAKGPLAVIRCLAQIGSDYAIGRHYHLGTSIPGKKGRIAYESPAADLLYAAHIQLEKHAMTQAQIFFKKSVAQEFGRLVHEAKFFDPLMDDLRAYLAASQARVSGVCTLYLNLHRIDAVTVDTPYDLLSAAGSVYGEQADFYSGADALGSSKIAAYEQVLYHAIKDRAT